MRYWPSQVGPQQGSSCWVWLMPIERDRVWFRRKGWSKNGEVRACTGELLMGFAWWHLKLVSVCVDQTYVMKQDAKSTLLVKPVNVVYIFCLLSLKCFSLHPHPHKPSHSHPYFKTFFLLWKNLTWVIWAKLFTLLVVALLFVVLTLIAG